MRAWLRVQPHWASQQPGGTLNATSSAQQGDRAAAPGALNFLGMLFLPGVSGSQEGGESLS